MSAAAPNREQVQQRDRAIQERLPTVLLHHWASMVSEQADQLDEYRQQLRTVEARADRVYRDNVILHDTVNTAYADTAAAERLANRMSDLVLRILRENPIALQQEYASEYFAAINEFNELRPIDLTAVEEIDENM